MLLVCAGIIWSTIFWYVTTFSPIEILWRFGGMYSLHLLSIFAALLLAGFFLWLLFGAEIRSSTLLRNVDGLLLDYTVLISSQTLFPSGRFRRKPRPTHRPVCCCVWMTGRWMTTEAVSVTSATEAASVHSQSAAPACDVARTWLREAVCTGHKQIASFSTLTNTCNCTCVWELGLSRLSLLPLELQIYTRA
jgi:hypothetical protein